MSLFYDLNPMAVLFDPALLVKTHIAKVDISGVVKNDGFGDGRHQGKDETIFVLFDIEGYI